jgi:hypothetical protein
MSPPLTPKDAPCQLESPLACWLQMLSVRTPEPQVGSMCRLPNGAVSSTVECDDLPRIPRSGVSRLARSRGFVDVSFRYDAEAVDAARLDAGRDFCAPSI